MADCISRRRHRADNLKILVDIIIQSHRIVFIPWYRFNTKTVLPGIVTAITKIRRWLDSLIFITGIQMLVRRHFHIETVLWIHYTIWYETFVFSIKTTCKGLSIHDSTNNGFHGCKWMAELRWKHFRNEINAFLIFTYINFRIHQQLRVAAYMKRWCMICSLGTTNIFTHIYTGDNVIGAHNNLAPISSITLRDFHPSV